MNYQKFRTIKPEIRVLGVDDGVFTPRTKGLVPVVGVVFRGGYWLDGVIHTKIQIDGLDATNKIASMILNSPHYKQLRVTMLNGVTFAGFNVVDIKKLHDKTKLPIIVITREKPDFEKIRAALKNLPKSEERWNAIKNAGKIIEIPIRGSKNEKIYMQTCGILEEDAVKIVHSTSTRSNIPEALRVAHIIASGISITEPQ
ncbi:DUF99 family protein [Candidatus Bathyarchaeota archaeon]|nr:MAG: DUF99 family protein [Candidatus Bathyarchaeota archaeon]RLI18437.1 MAG: hypothetical protein DRO44_01180 [Candidatus Bathyarchaeota archaeon]